MILFFACLYTLAYSQSDTNVFQGNMSFVTRILIANQNTHQAELYNIYFDCNHLGCNSQPVLSSNLVWSSPVTEGISEVKHVLYQNVPAVLTNTYNGAVVYEYPSGRVLFKKELDQTKFYIDIHSADVLPDGNVAVVGASGVVAILYPDWQNPVQTREVTTFELIEFGHGVVFEKATSRLHVGGYLTVKTFQYTSTSDNRGQLTLVDSRTVRNLYENADKNEDGANEDGIHDLYPTNEDEQTLFMTTGEHAYTIDVNTKLYINHPTLFSIPSKNSQTFSVGVPNKGGIKAISQDIQNGVIFAKAAPWFKEIGDLNYYHSSSVVIWSMNKYVPNDGFCSQPDYDLTDRCKIDFSKLPQPLNIYKARVFLLNKFSYNV